MSNTEERPESEEEEFEDDQREEFIEEGEDLFDDDEDEDEDFTGDLGLLITNLLATPDGETVCSALISIATQLEMHNKIMIKMLAKMTKKDS
jgi:hypothetical protein